MSDFVMTPGEEFVQSTEYTRLVEDMLGKASELETEAKDVIGTSPEGGTGEFRQTEVRAVIDDPPGSQTPHIRNLFGTPEKTTKNYFPYFKVVGYLNPDSADGSDSTYAFQVNGAGVLDDPSTDSGGATTWPTAHRTNLSYKASNAKAVTLAHWEAAYKDTLSDTPRLQANIDNILMEGLYLIEDWQFLHGRGEDHNEIEGILNDPDVQTYTGTYDVSKTHAIRKAITRAQNSGYAPNGLVIHPDDWEEVQTEVNTSGEHLLKDRDPNKAWNLPVVATRAIERGKALVGSFGSGASLLEREKPNVRISGSHGTFFTENAVAMMAIERVALTIDRPESFVEVVFDSSPSHVLDTRKGPSAPTGGSLSIEGDRSSNDYGLATLTWSAPSDLGTVTGDTKYDTDYRVSNSGPWIRAYTGGTDTSDILILPLSVRTSRGWGSGNAYTVGDIVGVDGRYFVCIQDHTSAATNDPATDGGVDYWEELPADVLASAPDWGEPFYARVRAHNDIGHGGWLVVSATPYTSPTAPTNLAEADPPAVGSAKVTWDAPTEDGGDDNLLYRVEYKLETASLWTTADDTHDETDYTITGLTAQTDYDVRVSARNSQVTDYGAALSRANVQAGALPGIASGVSTARSGDADVELTWTPPTYFGNPTATGGRVRLVDPDGVAQPISTDITTTQASLIVLDSNTPDGQAYNIFIDYFNSLGTSTEDEGAQVQMYNLPNTPVIGTTVSSSGIITLDFNIPGGSGGIGHYFHTDIDIQVTINPINPAAAQSTYWSSATNANLTWGALFAGNYQGTLTITGLNTGDIYGLRLRSRNPKGLSPVSPQTRVTVG